MSVFGKMINNVRKNFGFGTLADAMDQKIDRVNEKEERILKQTKQENEEILHSLQYENFLPQTLRDEYEEIIQCFNNIKSLAEKDINSYNSEMKGKIGNYTGNLFELNNYLNILRGSIDNNLFLDFKKQFAQLTESLLKSYITKLLQQNFQNNNQNIEILNLIEQIKIKLKSVYRNGYSITSYQDLENIYIYCLQEKGKLDLKIMQINQQMSPYINQKATIDYELSNIERQRAMLRSTKEYLEKDADRKAMRK